MSQPPSAMDPFKPIVQQQAEAKQARDEARTEQRALVRAAFAGAPRAVEWLRQAKAMADAQPSYRPGLDPHHVAWNEGRRAALHDLVQAIDDAMKG